MDTPRDAYEEAIEKMARAICGGAACGWEQCTAIERSCVRERLEEARAAAEAVGLRELLMVLNEPFLPDFPPPALPDPNYVFKCPINYAGCVRNCGDYGCGN
jgi:hypothetical protein